MIFNEEDERIITIGKTNARGQYKKFGIRNKDRSRHMYVIGQTGTGKSTLLENMAVQDINYGNGLIFMDPHGQSVESILDKIPADRVDDVIYFAPNDSDNPIGLNIMEDIGYEKRHLVVSSLLSSFRRIWGENSWSDRMEHILSNTLFALLEYPNSTLLDVGRMYSSKKFRDKVTESLRDPQIKEYWEVEFANYTERFRNEATPAIQNKLGQFVSNPIIRNIVGQPKSSFSFRQVMDERKILLINLSKGTIGDTNARLLGVLFSTKIYLSALSRSDLTKKQLEESPSCTLYVDEFQSFASDTFADVLSEARKYKLNLVLAHQYIAQLSDQVKEAVFGNIPTIISFRVGPFDSKILSEAFTPIFSPEHLIGLPRYHMYMTLNIDGAASKPFSAVSLEPDMPPAQSQRNKVVQNTRNLYSKPKEEIEKMITKNLGEFKELNKPNKPFEKKSNNNKFKKPEFKPREDTTKIKDLINIAKEKPINVEQEKRKEIKEKKMERPKVGEEEGWSALEDLKKNIDTNVKEKEKESKVISIEDLKKEFHKK